MNVLINKIFIKLDEQDIQNVETYFTIRRLVKILQSIIVISEKRGLKVKPHKAVLKGDMLQQIIVKYYVVDVQDYTRKVVDRQITIEARTTTTVFEFIDQVARMLGQGYKHAKLSY